MITGTGIDTALDFIGHMGNYLHRAAKVIAASLATQYGLVDLATGKVVVLGHFRTQKTLVMAQIQICLCAILSHIDFTVLVGAHGARINIEIGVELEDSDTKTSRLEYGTQRSRCNTFTQRRNNTASNKNKTRHNDPATIAKRVEKCISGSGVGQDFDLILAGAHPTQDGVADYQKGGSYSTAIYKELTCQWIFLPRC